MLLNVQLNEYLDRNRTCQISIDKSDHLYFSTLEFFNFRLFSKRETSIMAVVS